MTGLLNGRDAESLLKRVSDNKETFVLVRTLNVA